MVSFCPLIYILLSVCASSSYCLPSQHQVPLQEGVQSPFTPDFNQDVDHLLSHWLVPGLSIAIVDGNDTFSKVANTLYVNQYTS